MSKYKIVEIHPKDAYIDCPDLVGHIVTDDSDKPLEDSSYENAKGFVSGFLHLEKPFTLPEGDVITGLFCVAFKLEKMED